MDPTKQSRKALVFTISSGISLGALLAIFFLLGTPAIPMTKAPSEEYFTRTQYVVPYVKGRVASGESAELKTLIRKFENRMPGEALLAEQDLNWLLSEWVSGSGDEGSEVRVAAPSVHLKEKGMDVVLPIAVNEVEGLNFVFQWKAEFVSGEDGPEFRVNDFYVNSLRLPSIGMTSLILNKLSEVEFSPKMVEGWNNVSEISHSSGSLVVTIGQKGG